MVYWKNSFILQKIILILQSVGKQGKYQLCFIWRIKSYTQRAKVIMGIENVEKITSGKQIETL